LRKADSDKHTAIAFPTLGAGGFGYPADLIIQDFSTVVNRFPARFLRKVDLVVFPSDSASIQVCQQHLFLKNLFCSVLYRN